MQLDAFLTPGTLLRSAREKQELSQREVADRLHLMPGYPAIIEGDDYQALRHPAFARGYVKAYGKLVGVDEQRLLGAYDRMLAEAATVEPKRVRRRPVQLERAGMGVIIGLLLLALFVAGVWWMQAGPGAVDDRAARAAASESSAGLSSREYSMTGER